MSFDSAGRHLTEKPSAPEHCFQGQNRRGLFLRLAGLIRALGRPCTPSPNKILEFAKQSNPQWLHTDPEAAARSRFGGLIGSDWQTCGIAMRPVAEAALVGSEGFA